MIVMIASQRFKRNERADPWILERFCSDFDSLSR
jgi:hypothetical protein